MSTDAELRGSAATKARPRLLFLCHVLPFPPDEGVRIRAYNLLRLLAREFDVTALCFYRNTARADSMQPRAAVKDLQGLEGLTQVHVFSIPQERSKLRFCRDHLLSVIRGRPYTRFVYESAAYASRLRDVLSTEAFDLVHLDSLDLCAYLPMLKDIPVVCSHHNVESVLMSRRASAESSWLRRRYLALQARLLQDEERRWTGRVALNVVVSAVDRDMLIGIVPYARTTIAPNGVDTRSVRRAAESGAGILFVGGYGWAPNRDGMLHFCEYTLPLIRLRRAHARVTWIGRAPAEIQHEYAERYGITMTGYVDDITTHLEAAACCIVPLRTGGGTRLKILDAWAAGRAVVSTRVGCEGLDARDQENILIRDDPAEFAAAVCDVLENNELRQRLGSEARATAERSYDWEHVGTALNTAYLDLVNVAYGPASDGCGVVPR